MSTKEIKTATINEYTILRDYMDSVGEWKLAEYYDNLIKEETEK